jgi:DNA adenine methylase
VSPIAKFCRSCELRDAKCYDAYRVPSLVKVAGGTKPWVSPLLRWAGSKRTLVPTLTLALGRATGVRRYVEPFAGSACLFFAARPREAVLGDLNGGLVDTYRTIRDHPRLVARRMHSWPTDESTYYSVRASAPEELDAVGTAARFLYLNRLCFNGIFRTNRDGKFNVPFGKSTGALPTEEHVYRCAVALRAADLRSGDFDQTTADVGPGDFVYLDPPYTDVPSSAYGVYGYGSFDGSDLSRVVSTLERIDRAGATFVFSYAQSDALSEMLQSHWMLSQVEVAGQIAARVSARRPRVEVLVSNRALL